MEFCLIGKQQKNKKFRDVLVSKSWNHNSEKGVQRSSEFISEATWTNLFTHDTQT